MSSFAFGRYGAADSWDALLYGDQHPNTVAFLAQQVSSVSDRLTETGRAFMGRVTQIFDHYNGDNAIRYARGVLAKAKGVFQGQHIHSIWETIAMQDASITMQRWIMANPNVRRMYHAQKCDGYSDTYVDVDPGAVGDDHYDYRRVMDGQFVWNPDEETDWQFTQYLESLKEGDRDLIHAEQVDIRNTWTAMDLVMALAKDDPTSAVRGTL